MTRFRRLRRAARHPAFWFALPVLVYVPALTGPFAFDDFLLLLRSEAHIRGESRRLDLFRVSGTTEEWEQLRDRGTFPWWAPKGRITFFRPLAQWSFYFDVLMFGRNTVGHRLVSLAWFALALLAVRRLYLAASGNAEQAGAAAFFFGISHTVTQPATFICNRADLLVLVGLAIAATAYLTAASRPSKFAVVLAAGGFAFALLSKETAIGLAAVVLLYETLVHPRRQRFQDLPGVIAIVFAVLAMIYLAHLVATRPWHLGLGGDQERSNVSFLAQAPLSIMLYLAVWTLGFPIDVLAIAGTWATAAVCAAGLLCALLFAFYLARAVRRDPDALFFVFWAAVFVGLGLMTYPSSRVLCLGTVGWAYLLSRVLLPPTEDHRAAPMWLRCGLVATSGMVSLFMAVFTVITQNHLERQLQNGVQEYVNGQQPPLRNGDTLVIAEPHHSLELIFTPERLEFITGLRNVSVMFLASPGSGSLADRADDHTLRLTTNSGDLLDRKLYELSLGRTEKRREGAAFATRDFTAQIERMAEDGRVTSMMLRFNEPLASSRLHFYPPELAVIAHGQR